MGEGSLDFLVCAYYSFLTQYTAMYSCCCDGFYMCSVHTHVHWHRVILAFNDMPCS